MEWRCRRPPTIRERFFGVFRRDGAAIRWPEQTHGMRDSEVVKAGRLKPWVGANTVIDWSLPAPSIFESKSAIKAAYGVNAVRPLADNAMKRIAKRLDKFVLREDEPFLAEVNHAGEFQGQTLREPRATRLG